MDISAQINKLTRERQLLEDQVKDVKSEIKNINVKIRKLETIARHAEDVLGDQVQIKDGPVFPTPIPELTEPIPVGGNNQWLPQRPK